LTGVEFDFLLEEDEIGPAYRSEAAARAAWKAHRDELTAEMGGVAKPWAWFKFETQKRAILKDADARRDRPAFPDAIQRGDWRLDEDLLWDVHQHQWHTEYYRPAKEHPWYKSACKAAKNGTNAAKIKWDPVWIRTYTDVEAVRLGCWFDESKANKAVAFFRLLRHSKGKFAKKPFVLLPWQKFDVVMPLFGWQRPAEAGHSSVGLRRYSHGYIEIPKKNGKSTLCAAISLYLLVADGESGAEVYNVAAAIDQAKIVFKEALRMARACPYFAGILKYRESIKQIEYPGDNAEYVVISSEAATAEGKNISGLIFDELHAQRDRDLFDALVYGGDARDQGLFLSITTAGVYNPLAIGWEQHTYARRCLAGESGPGEDTSFFGYIRGVAESKEEGSQDWWKDPYWWYRANPGLGVTLDYDKFERAAATAAEVASKQNSFKRYKVNVWVQAAEAAFNIADWNQCRLFPESFDSGRQAQLMELMKGRRCFAGLDLSAVSDLTALVLCFPPEPEDDDPFYHFISRFWLPEDNIKSLGERHNAPYEMWAEQGWIDLTPGDMVDLKQVENDIMDWAEQFDPVNWRVDPHRATGLITQLDEEHGLDIVRFNQSNVWFNGPTVQFETIVKRNEARHCGHPIFDWMMGNCQFNRDAHDRIRIVKTRGIERFKVDGPVAAVMALDGSMRDTGGGMVLGAGSLTVGG
jgi:phage terminase large subunit-like protein